MSCLTVYPQDNPKTPLLATEDVDVLRSELEKIGVRFERWACEHEVADDDGNEAILLAYKSQIDRLVAEKGYQSWDVVSMHPAHPDKSVFRKKFLSEHTHSEDEVRFFVRGRGLFVLHTAERVFSVLCEKDDLISVPANTKHWFDMGANPRFTAIRLFNNPDGWVANFTGDDIADAFPGLSGP